VRLDVPLKLHPAAAFGEVDQVPLGTDQPPAGISDKECTAAERDAFVPAPVPSPMGVHAG
jgi:hypothetical protein